MRPTSWPPIATDEAAAECVGERPTAVVSATLISVSRRVRAGTRRPARKSLLCRFREALPYFAEALPTGGSMNKFREMLIVSALAAAALAAPGVASARTDFSI